MENKNTFSLKKNINTELEQFWLIPQAGDELAFYEDEDSALAAYCGCITSFRTRKISTIYYRDRGRNTSCESIEEEFLTDIFKKGQVNGTLANPIFIAGEKFGFFGCRVKLTTQTPKGHFFLYKTE